MTGCLDKQEGSVRKQLDQAVEILVYKGTPLAAGVDMLRICYERVKGVGAGVKGVGAGV